MAPHSSTLACKNPMDGGAWKAAVHGVAEGRTQLNNFTFTFHFHALKKEMATHSSVLAWRIPGTGEPGGLPSMGSHRVGHDWSNLAAAADFPKQHASKIKRDSTLTYLSRASQSYIVITTWTLNHNTFSRGREKKISCFSRKCFKWWLKTGLPQTDIFYLNYL